MKPSKLIIREQNIQLFKKIVFFSKSNLSKYLYDARVEFHKQKQHYHTDISKYYNEYLNSIVNLKNEINTFSIYDVSDLVTGNPTRRRGYIRSDADIWNIWRALILPKISYLSILKLLPKKLKEKSKNPCSILGCFWIINLDPLCIQN